MANIGGIPFPPSSALVGNVHDLFQTLIDNTMTAMPVKRVTTMQEVNDAQDALPPGTIVVFEGTDGGLGSLQTFTVATGYIHLTDGARLTSLSGFLAAMTKYPNIKVTAGRSFCDMSTGRVGIWNTDSGGYILVASGAMLTGGGTVPALKARGLYSKNITFPVDSFTAPPSYVGVQMSGAGFAFPGFIRATGFTANFRAGSVGTASDQFHWLAVQ